MTDDIKSRLIERSSITKIYYKYGKIKSHLDELQVKTDDCTALILDAKEKYIKCMSDKLNNPLTAPKSYWAIVINRKTPPIPPSLVNGDIITNFSQKADLFNKFCRTKYTP